MLLGHGPKAFRVPDSCRATERNDNSISVDVTDDMPLIKELERFRCFQFDSCFGPFDIAG
jgi:hypothetical protein